MNTDLWIATIPPAVLARPVPVATFLELGSVIAECPLCEVWLFPPDCPAVCPCCHLTLDWRGYRSRRRAAWGTVKAWLLARMADMEPPSVSEAAEAAETLLDDAYIATERAEYWLECYGDKPLRWILRQWSRQRRAE